MPLIFLLWSGFLKIQEGIKWFVVGLEFTDQVVNRDHQQRQQDRQDSQNLQQHAALDLLQLFPQRELHLIKGAVEFLEFLEESSPDLDNIHGWLL